ncbi:MAG: ShlB/FhaC/HecB family hemolysin secretion/activation protein, partial [Hydrocarboniphaga effusa]|nr:ShlB/FhaC/HecB family hemolysin secretion/activation protein [Hydrocarboniphaga effusa]
MLSLGLSTAAWAQTVTPGQVVDTLKPPAPVQPSPPAGALDLPRPPPVARKADGGRQVTVQRFEFEGNT